jgi:hypothetical protein
MEKTIAFFEKKGSDQAEGRLQRRGLVCGFPGILQGRGHFFFDDDARQQGKEG